jgi:hypothetical protein
LEPTTKEKDGSYWLTPTATSISQRSQEALEYRKQWRASTGRKTVPPGNLAEQVTVSGEKPCSDMLNPTMWPTPCARDWKDTMNQTDRGLGSRDDSKLVPMVARTIRVNGQRIGGNLNPMWVEWLMGYKIGWTELDVSAIQWFRSKFKPPSESLLD